MRAILFAAVCGGVLLAMPHAAAQPGDYPIQPVPFTQVQFDGGFWGPRLETNRAVTLPYDFAKCEETGRISNFAKAGGLMDGPHQGIFFDDSDVFKIVEGAAYCLALQPDPELDAYLDRLITLFAAAQEDDGYLYTARTINPDRPAPGAGRERWANIKDAHELYNVGHMYEAAVAHFQATGKRTFLDVAIRNADLVAEVFGPGRLMNPPGHQEIEIGLVKLYRVTCDRKYLDLAQFFLDQRGNAEGHALYGLYNQDHLPVTEQTEAVGHAVRAGYMYAGMADVAALTGRTDYVDAIGRLWENVVGRRMYLTGGIGSRRQGEAFGDDYELPNRTAYTETCAAIANAMWNHRLFLLHGDAKYADVLERVLYNGFLAGISLEGNTFFYPNPLEADGVTAFNHGSVLRQPWFGCSCCPSNVVRFLPSLLGYAYARRGEDLYVNLYAAGAAETEVAGTPVRVAQDTRYPWDGAVRLTVTPETPANFALRLRIPGWAQGRPVPGELYTYLDATAEPFALAVNGEAVDPAMERGYTVLRREWKAGDTVELRLPMPVRRVLCHEAVEDNRGMVALERGPVVYCAEGVDNAGQIFNLVVDDTAVFEPEHRADLLGGVTVLRGTARAVRRADEGGLEAADHPFTAVPYHAWAHRGAGPMAVWLARSDDAARPAPAPTLASRSTPTASHCHGGDTVTALNDQLEPADSLGGGIPRMTWWARKGSREWVQYDFPAPARVRAVEVYWFDDTGEGQCRVPKSWRLHYRDGDEWKPVRRIGKPGTARDRYNRLEFPPVETDALRIEVQLQPGFSGGILEWKVEEE